MAFAAARMIKEKAKRPSMDLALYPIGHDGKDGPPYPLPRSSSGRALLKGALARGHVKRTRCKGKNGKKGKGETLDLIVTIDLVKVNITLRKKYLPHQLTLYQHSCPFISFYTNQKMDSERE